MICTYRYIINGTGCINDINEHTVTSQMHCTFVSCSLSDIASFSKVAIFFRYA